jgi:hypothetical protein
VSLERDLLEYLEGGLPTTEVQALCTSEELVACTSLPLPDSVKTLSFGPVDANRDCSDLYTVGWYILPRGAGRDVASDFGRKAVLCA